MIQELQTGILDINNKYTVDFNCKQLDDIILKIIVYDKSLPADLSDYNCRLKAFKADQVPLIQNTNITIKDNVVTIKADKQLTTTNGIVKAELQFINKTTLEKKSTFYLEIKVAASVLDVDGVVSTPTCTILEEIDNKLDQIENIKLDIIEAVKVKNDLNLSKTDANNINNTLKITITNADNKKKEVETVINNASNKIKEVQDSTNTANSTKQAVDNSVVQANSSKQALDTSKLSADNTKKEVDNSIKIADEKIEIIKNLDPEHVIEDVKKLKEQVLENTYTKIETDSTLTKLESCKDSFVHNMQIKGRTLQNLLGTGCINRTITLKNSLNVNAILKSNTTYTLISTISNTSYSDTRYGLFWNIVIDGVIKYNDFGLEDKTTIVNKITTKSGETKLIGFGLNSNNSDDSHATYSGMLLEGDWTNKEIPPYFEGIKSVGEAEGNKISILSCGKNLYNGNLPMSITANKAGTGGFINKKIISPNGITIVAIDNKGNIIKSSNVAFRVFDNGIADFESFSTGILYVPRMKKFDKFEIFWNNLNPNDVTISKVIFGLGNCIDTILNYGDYKEDKTEILTGTEPLRGLPSGVQDEVDFEKGILTRNVGKIVFDENDNFNDVSSSFPDATGNTLMFSCISRVLDKDTSWMVVSNKFAHNNIDTKRDVEGIFISVYSSGRGFYIRINKSKLSTPDANGFKKLLKTWADAGTPLEVYYQSANPVVEKLNIKDTLQTFTDGYIQLDNPITPFTQLEYSTNLPSAMGGLTKVTDRLVDDVTNVESTISDINIELGDEPLKTTSETIRGAINENTLQLKELTIKTYTNLSQIGLKDADFLNKTQVEVADMIVNAMPNDSMLKYKTAIFGNDSNLAILLPERQDGILNIFKKNSQGVEFNYLTNVNTMYVSFYGNWKTPHLTDWMEVATSEKFEISTKNQWYGAWTTNSKNVIWCEKNGYTTHVEATLGAGVVNDNTVVVEFPNVAKDMWIYALAEDGSMGSFYLGYDGKLYVKNVIGNKVYKFDFSYRNN
ncbi:hypothetical protein FC764_04125 [Clostridium botulinum]|nr:hypothetical protein [Clostridium botulinum]